MDHLNDFLLTLIEDKRALDIEFIEEQAKQFREEVAILLETIRKDDSLFLKNLFYASQYSPQMLIKYEKIVAKYEQVKKISDNEFNTLDSCLSYGYFIYFTDFILNRVYIQCILDWLNRTSNKYPESGLLKFLHGYAIDAALNFFGIEPKQDIEKLIFDPVKMDHEGVIDAQERYLSIIQEYQKKHPELLEQQYELLGKAFFPKLNQSDTSYTDALISYYLSKIASYHQRVGRKEKSKELLNEAINLYKDNSVSIVQKAYLEVKEKPSKATEDFKRGLDLVDNQFCNLPLQTYVKVGAYSGIAYLYYKSGLYEEAEQYYNKILKSLESLKQRFPVLQTWSRAAKTLLNQSRNSLDKGDFVGALENLTNIKKLIPSSLLADNLLANNLLAAMHNNLGLVYLKQGIYENADTEFHKAIELNPRLAHAYYNLGSLHYEQGNIERAKKLFQTSIKVNPNYNEGRETLKKLEVESEVNDWWKWWFKGETSPGKMRFKVWMNPKRIIGMLLALEFIILVSIISYNAAFGGKDVPNSVLGVLAIIVVLLILPFVKKIEAGPVKFETESKGEQPLIS